MMEQHELLPDGESTEKWAIRTPGFLGSVKQLVCCARCGDCNKKGPHERLRWYDLMKPTVHFLCDECYEALPD